MTESREKEEKPGDCIALKIILLENPRRSYFGITVLKLFKTIGRREYSTIEKYKIYIQSPSGDASGWGRPATERNAHEKQDQKEISIR